MKTLEELKIEALAKHLETDLDEIEEDLYAEDLFSYGSQEFLVLTYEEAQEKAAEYIKENLWCIKPSFLVSYLKKGIDLEVADLREIQENLYERSNTVLSVLIQDLDKFIEDAISSDGFGHFLATYDGEEYEVEASSGTIFHIYRVN